MVAKHNVYTRVILLGAVPYMRRGAPYVEGGGGGGGGGFTATAVHCLTWPTLVRLSSSIGSTAWGSQMM